MFSSGNLSQAEKCYMHFDLYDDNWDNIRDSDSEIPYFDLEQDMLRKMKKKFRKKHFAFWELNVVQSPYVVGLNKRNDFCEN